ncbi:Retrovirus-related Pol polyprotein from transposon TNT 1-94 [Cucumis melo var. makuwa]|uniref:Retrovirus-related Pol polyprotein from transposon TNT 1-94 n=1 Tax=Cucumis melo var. makuwa TaxID=1194695 RepID=A0A5D3D5H9_CUCMM|nr:Retrovirus-related Pol polyprotein from transposon TNT 1-94 [Cucumis melo var. makuwa]TYK18807.1 Retrovirus-related Pol polyprotein from transposon TNT 1-94 [Cucumis melo var. makuwa]
MFGVLSVFRRREKAIAFFAFWVSGFSRVLSASSWCGSKAVLVSRDVGFQWVCSSLQWVSVQEIIPSSWELGIVITSGNRTWWGVVEEARKSFLTKSLRNKLYLKEKFFGYMMDQSKGLEENLDEFQKIIVDLYNIDRSGYTIKSENGVMKVTNGSLVKLRGTLRNGLYVLEGTAVSDSAVMTLE